MSLNHIVCLVFYSATLVADVAALQCQRAVLQSLVALPRCPFTQAFDHIRLQLILLQAGLQPLSQLTRCKRGTGTRDIRISACRYPDILSATGTHVSLLAHGVGQMLAPQYCLVSPLFATGPRPLTIEVPWHRRCLCRTDKVRALPLPFYLHVDSRTASYQHHS